MVGPVLAVCGYLLGSVCFGPVLAARHGIDLRAVGSGNVGATNVGRALGKRTARLVMGLDGLKGFAPVLAARLWLGAHDPWTAMTGVAAAVGHVLPVWHRFRGGKGAATAAGVLLAAVPLAGVAAVTTFALLKKASRRASVGSLAGALVGAGVAVALEGRTCLSLMAVALCVLVVVRHASNIARLLRGEEPPS